MVKFAGHLHVHDEYSLLDGNANRNQLSYEAVRKGQTHLGITNHGRLAGVLEHVHACRHPEKHENPVDPSEKRTSDERLIPAIGLEAYYRPDRFMDLTDQEKFGKNGHNWAQHLCLHAANLDGWKTLMRLSSKSWVKREFGGGFYGKPVIDLDMLKEDHEGIVISTACISSPLSQAILNGDESGAKRFVRRMEKLSHNGVVWFELMPHDLDMQRQVNIGKINLAMEMGHPVVASGDVHMPYKAWKDTHLIVMMAATRQTISSREKKAEAGEDVYGHEIDTIFLSSGKEMREMFTKHHPDLPGHVVDEALANTHDFFRGFRPWVFGKRTKMPHVEGDARKVVKKWVKEGLARIKRDYPDSHWEQHPYEDYEKRTWDEWEVLVEKDVLGYFYIVGDFVRWAKSDLGLPKLTSQGRVKRRANGDIIYEGTKRPIRVGLGRGSAAGCIISYEIGITAIDPIPHRLLFERFLNPDRVGMPDIDMDFESGDEGREMVKEYLRRLYGHDHVADVIAYQTFAPRAVIRAVAETQDVPFSDIKKVTDSIGDTERGLEKIAAVNPIVAEFKKKFDGYWKHMLRLEDQIKNDSRHASAIIITDEPVTEQMPVQTGSDGKSIITAWADRIEFPVVSEFGWVKFDILGVNSLNKQEVAVQLIKEHFDVEVEPNDLPPLRDPYDCEQEVIDGFVKGLTTGVFQFGGRGITDLLRKIRPNNTVDIAVANALYRPGPIKLAQEYAQRKNGEVKWSYWHDAVEPVLGETYGIIAFQEQVMETCKVLANFSGAQADFMRKAISKLYRLGKEEAQKEMAPFWELWVDGCRSNGLKDDAIKTIWAAILEFAGYGFNRSHSASYGLQAYQDMWLKLHYPLAFFAALLTVEKKDKRKEQEQFLRAALREARVFDIEALPPDVNRSGVGWTLDDGHIRYGLVSINEMGGGAAQQIIENRPYESYRDFIIRGSARDTTGQSDVNIKHAIALAKAGAFDSIEDREFLLGRVRQYDTNVIKFEIKMTCGCTKSRTVKVTQTDLNKYRQMEPGDILKQKIEETLDKVVCGRHADGEIEDYTVQDDRYLVAQFIKDRPKDKPDDIEPPDPNEIAEFERDALNISMTTGSVAIRYHEFIDSRIFTEEEVEELPRKPKRTSKGGKKLHGTFCTCEDCDAARCIIGGEIVNSKVIKTKNGDSMAFLDLAFGANHFNCTMFPYQYQQYGHLLTKPSAFLVAGSKNDRGQITIDEMQDVVEVAKEFDWEPEPIAKKAKSNNKSGDIVEFGGGMQGMLFVNEQTSRPKIKSKRRRNKVTA